ARPRGGHAARQRPARPARGRAAALRPRLCARGQWRAALDAVDARALAPPLRRLPRPRNRFVRRTTLLLAAAAVLPRLAVVLHERGAILSAYTEKSDDFARTFVHSGTFGLIPGQPSAYTQPLYGWFLIP